MRKLPDIRDRAVAALVGLAVGDALARPSDSRPRGGFDPIRGFRRTATYQPGDTGRPTNRALQACGCLSRGYFSPDVFAERLRFPSIDTADAYPCIVPLVIFGHANFRFVTYAAQITVGVTTVNAAAIAVGGLFAAALFAAIQGRGKEPSLSYFDDRQDFGPWRGRSVEQVRPSGMCVQVAKAALWSIESTNDFDSAVLAAANLGHASGNIAALTGALAGAIYGDTGHILARNPDVVGRFEDHRATAEDIFELGVRAGGALD